MHTVVARSTPSCSHPILPSPNYLPAVGRADSGLCPSCQRWESSLTVQVQESSRADHSILPALKPNGIGLQRCVSTHE